MDDDGSAPWNAVLKGRVENRLHKEVCAKNISLARARQRSKWIGVFRIVATLESRDALAPAVIAAHPTRLSPLFI